MTLLDVRDLVVRFRTADGIIYAVNGVTFELEAGETLGLVGESGCGKSVTNLAIMRLLPKPAGRIEGGQVLFDGLDVLAMAEPEVRDLRGKEIAMIFQDPMTSLNPVYRIGEQIAEAIRAHEKTDRRTAKRRAVELLRQVEAPGGLHGDEMLGAARRPLEASARARVARVHSVCGLSLGRQRSLS